MDQQAVRQRERKCVRDRETFIAERHHYECSTAQRTDKVLAGMLKRGEPRK